MSNSRNVVRYIPDNVTIALIVKTNSNWKKLTILGQLTADIANQVSLDLLQV